MELSTSVQLKLRRAQEHAEFLRGIVLAWGNPNPHRFVTEQQRVISALSARGTD